MVSFDAVREVVEYIQELFPTEITTRIFYVRWYVLRTDGVAMRSSLHPVVANYFMERCEQAALVHPRPLVHIM